MRFSDYFKLDKTQAELDFVDIPLDTDIKLFVDPSSLSRIDDEWYIESHNLVIDFFEKLIATIRNGSKIQALELLNHLGEPDGTNLGLSQGKPLGKGIGDKQAKALYKKLHKSKAVETGYLKDLSDCELLVEGISFDKISDITTNIIRKKLIEYTNEQCNLLDIETTKVSAGMFWDWEAGKWRDEYVNLPIYQKDGISQKIILVPKLIVRYVMLLNTNDYYNNFILKYLQSEHLSLNTALVETLREGKKRVTKKKLKEQEEYKQTKKFLFEFSEQHPDIFKKYKEEKSQTSEISITNEEIEKRHTKRKKIDYKARMKELDVIASGAQEANKYHSYILGVLTSIFHPDLINPKKERPINDGRKRIDITFDNISKDGFFYFIHSKHKIHCPIIIIECKNYSQDLKNPEYDQLTGRFSIRRGHFGILVCRKIEDKEKMIKSCKDVLNDGRGCIIVLDDIDIKNMLRHMSNNFYEGVDKILFDKLNQLL